MKEKKQATGVRLSTRLRLHRELYILLIPILVYLFIFWLLPLYGIQIAFRDFKVADGFFGSKFVWFKHFRRFFKSYYFERTLKNTLGINLYGLIISFPLTIILSLLFNEIRREKVKNAVQVISYAPNFLSTVVICGMLITFLSPSGMINGLRTLFGKEAIDFMADPDYFWHVYVWSGVWQGIGFGTIMYTSAMSSIPEELYEAATIDGASRIQKMWYITLPSIQFVIMVMLIMSIGNMLSLGFEKVFLLQNNLNLGASEVISTYVYKAGLIDGKYSYTTAISLFNTVINLILLGGANAVSKKVNGVSLW